MTVAMKIRKGDTVHILAGKDRGKEGRVIDAMPRDRKVLVENLNLVKRHTRPRPLKDTSRRRHRREAGAAARFPRDARLPDVQPPYPGRHRDP